MNISLAITTFNRYELTIKSFEKVLLDKRIDDIVIVDDKSTDQSFIKLANYFYGNSKVRTIQQAENRGMSVNKMCAISLCRNEWVIILDSDNELSSEYIDALYELGEWKEDTIYAPEWAKPTFDYRQWSGICFDKNNIKEYIGKPYFGAMLNTSNYVVNKNFYLKCYKEDKSIKETDTIHHLKNHLEQDGKFYVVPNMQYQHLVHENSGFMLNVNYNMAKSFEIEKQIMEL